MDEKKEKSEKEMSTFMRLIKEGKIRVCRKIDLEEE